MNALVASAVAFSGETLCTLNIVGDVASDYTSQIVRVKGVVPTDRRSCFRSHVLVNELGCMERTWYQQ
jgi:hypothetical protein